MSITSYRNEQNLSEKTSCVNVDLLSKYINEQGKIIPRRVTGMSAKQQKRITKSIKRARILSLLPFSSK